MNDAPSRLRIDHLAPGQPCGSRRPRGSWWLPAGAGEQHAYEVRVLDVWESGRRDCPESVLVDLDVPASARIPDGRWQVRVWTERGASDWSAPAPWSIVDLPPAVAEATGSNRTSR